MIERKRLRASAMLVAALAVSSCTLVTDFESGLEDCQLLCRDRDGDGDGDPGECVEYCVNKTGWVSSSTDCDDTDPTLFECVATGDADAGCDDGGCEEASRDDDGDGFCAGDEPGTACPRGGGDCDDTDPRIHPAAMEPCGGPDLNCDGIEPSLQARADWYPVTTERGIVDRAVVEPTAGDRFVAVWRSHDTSGTTLSIAEFDLGGQIVNGPQAVTRRGEEVPHEFDLHVRSSGRYHVAWSALEWSTGESFLRTRWFDSGLEQESEVDEVASIDLETTVHLLGESTEIVALASTAEGLHQFDIETNTGTFGASRFVTDRFVAPRRAVTVGDTIVALHRNFDLGRGFADLAIAGWRGEPVATHADVALPQSPDSAALSSRYESIYASSNDMAHLWVYDRDSIFDTDTTFPLPRFHDYFGISHGDDERAWSTDSETLSLYSFERRDLVPGSTYTMSERVYPVWDATVIEPAESLVVGPVVARAFTGSALGLLVGASAASQLDFVEPELWSMEPAQRPPVGEEMVPVPRFGTILVDYEESRFYGSDGGRGESEMPGELTDEERRPIIVADSRSPTNLVAYTVGVPDEATCADVDEDPRFEVLEWFRLEDRSWVVNERWDLGQAREPSATSCNPIPTLIATTVDENGARYFLVEDRTKEWVVLLGPGGIAFLEISRPRNPVGSGGYFFTVGRDEAGVEFIERTDLTGESIVIGDVSELTDGFELSKSVLYPWSGGVIVQTVEVRGDDKRWRYRWLDYEGNEVGDHLFVTSTVRAVVGDHIVNLYRGSGDTYRIQELLPDGSIGLDEEFLPVPIVPDRAQVTPAGIAVAGDELQIMWSVSASSALVIHEFDDQRTDRFEGSAIGVSRCSSRAP